jgi:hypothetical protein
MKNWTFEENNENLIFKYRGETKMIFTPDGNICMNDIKIVEIKPWLNLRKFLKKKI